LFRRRGKASSNVSQENIAVAKPIRRKEKKKAGKAVPLPLGKENFFIIGAGVVVIIAGYVAMLEGSVEGFLSLVLSPILLVLGYCVIIPIGILYKRRDIRENQSGELAAGQLDESRGEVRAS
jgi:hypothetical protein